MNRTPSRWVLAALVVATLVLAGCGAAEDGHNETLVSQEANFYKAGASLAALGCSEDQNIKLYRAGEGAFDPVADGDYFPPGTHSLAVAADDRVVKGESLSQRVFISDGGGYQVEARYDGNSGYYLCDYTFFGPEVSPTQPLLIQIIYAADKKAAKAKYVVTTKEELRPAADELVEQGVGITLSRPFLDSLTPLIQGLMVEQGVSGIEIEGLYPADTAGEGVIKIKLKGGITSEIMLKDHDGAGRRQLTVGLEDLGFDGSGIAQVLNILLNLIGRPIIQAANLDEIVKMPLGFGLGEMLGSLLGAESAMFTEILPLDGDAQLSGMLGPLLEGLALESDTLLFMNILGLPQETDGEFVALGAGMYPADLYRDNLATDAEGNYLWPEVVVNDRACPDMAGLKGADTDMGLVLSQYGLNQVLSGIMESLTVSISDVRGIPMIKPAVADNRLDLEVSINPAGIAVDFACDAYDLKLVLNDVEARFIEVLPDDSRRSLAEVLSLDLCLYVDAGFGYDDTGAPVMTMTILPEPELSHTHVMRDNMGLGVLDHIDLVGIIFDLMRTDEDGGLTISLPLTELGIVPREGALPGWVQTTSGGDCFLGLAARGIDLDQLPLDTGACLIATAGR